MLFTAESMGSSPGQGTKFLQTVWWGQKINNNFYFFFFFFYFLTGVMGFSCGSAGKESACNAGNLGSIPGLERSPGGGNGNPLQYSCLESSMDRGAWWATPGSMG